MRHMVASVTKIEIFCINNSRNHDFCLISYCAVFKHECPQINQGQYFFHLHLQVLISLGLDLHTLGICWLEFQSRWPHAFFPPGNMLGCLSSSSHGNQRRLLTFFFFSHKVNAELSEQVQLFDEVLTFCHIFQLVLLDSYYIRTLFLLTYSKKKNPE